VGGHAEEEKAASYPLLFPFINNEGRIFEEKIAAFFPPNSSWSGDGDDDDDDDVDDDCQWAKPH